MKAKDLGILSVKIVVLAVLLMVVNGIGPRFPPVGESEGSRQISEAVVDSELNYRIRKGGPNPLVFEPEIDWSTFKDPNIIDGY